MKPVIKGRWVRCSGNDCPSQASCPCEDYHCTPFYQHALRLQSEALSKVRGILDEGIGWNMYDPDSIERSRARQNRRIRAALEVDQ